MSSQKPSQKTQKNNSSNESSQPQRSSNYDLIQAKSLPESYEAEVSVLGSMILDRNCVNDVVQKLSPDSFYRPENRIIYESLVALYEQLPPDKNMDLVLIKDELLRRNQFEDAGGQEYLKKIPASVATTANAEYYTEIVHEKYILRQLINVVSEVLEEAYNPAGEISDKLDQAEKKIFEVTGERVTGEAESMRDLLVKAFEEIDKRTGEAITGIPTGFTQLDTMTTGLHEGELIIMAGRPSMGKTSFAMNIAEHIGADEEQPVLIFSLEMGRLQLAERMLCSRGMIDSQAVRRGVMDSEVFQELLDTSENLSQAPIFIDDTPGMTPLEIRAKARRLKAQYDIKAVFVDYLQLMSLGGRVESRQNEISAISRQLKAMARELDVPVIVLSQLNRAAEQREDHRPRMSDLRESGSIEQDADVVMLIHREDYYHRQEAEYEFDNEAEIIIAKQRNGPTGIVKLKFHGEFTRFDNISTIDEPF
ncbi:Replicative DNA helicase [Sedimentisphaera cyanobacteriorum]|uniref:Replicative DNA helicase n=2 Tax=Sedimentisphaera cyanobacteriorum TaxID=1940790 RepID=A0A1Q2HMW3_9BACT|nr:Replicative DNA helicase [Sedimentisphaera cyanobacteriorum]